MEGYLKLSYLLNILRSDYGIGPNDLKALSRGHPELEELINKNRAQDLKGLNQEKIQQIAEEIAKTYESIKSQGGG